LSGGSQTFVFSLTGNRFRRTRADARPTKSQIRPKLGSSPFCFTLKPAFVLNFQAVITLIFLSHAEK
jgi:hypothetical protein